MRRKLRGQGLENLWSLKNTPKKRLTEHAIVVFKYLKRYCYKKEFFFLHVLDGQHILQHRRFRMDFGKAC